jgi:hypothetical protein
VTARCDVLYFDPPRSARSPATQPANRSERPATAGVPAPRQGRSGPTLSWFCASSVPCTDASSSPCTLLAWPVTFAGAAPAYQSAERAGAGHAEPPPSEPRAHPASRRPPGGAMLDVPNR